MNAIGARFTHGPLAGEFQFMSYASLPKSQAKQPPSVAAQAAKHGLTEEEVGKIDSAVLLAFLWTVAGRPADAGDDWRRERPLWFVLDNYWVTCHGETYLTPFGTRRIIDPGVSTQYVPSGSTMARPQTEPLRPLSPEEHRVLEQIDRSRSERAERVARARALLALSAGATFATAAARAGFRSAKTVPRLVRRFHREGMGAVAGRHGGGNPLRYGPGEQERVLREFRRVPDREQDGTATWSLSTLQHALRQAPDGLPQVSTFTIFETLHRAGYSCQENRTWCPTGTALRKRKRKDGTQQVVQVTDPQADEKRGRSSKGTP